MTKELASNLFDPIFLNFSNVSPMIGALLLLIIVMMIIVIVSRQAAMPGDGL